MCDEYNGAARVATHLRANCRAELTVKGSVSRHATRMQDRLRWTQPLV